MEIESHREIILGTLSAIKSENRSPCYESLCQISTKDDGERGQEYTNKDSSIPI